MGPPHSPFINAPTPRYRVRNWRNVKKWNKVDSVLIACSQGGWKQHDAAIKSPSGGILTSFFGRVGNFQLQLWYGYDGVFGLHHCPVHVLRSLQIQLSGKRGVESGVIGWKSGLWRSARVVSVIITGILRLVPYGIMKLTKLLDEDNWAARTIEDTISERSWMQIAIIPSEAHLDCYTLVLDFLSRLNFIVFVAALGTLKGHENHFLVEWNLGQQKSSCALPK